MPKKILLASTSSKKKNRLNRLLSGLNYEFLLPEDLNLPQIEISEGNDIYENAKLKAMVYFKKTNLPIIGYDQGLYIEGENINPALVKRNALQGKAESAVSDIELYILMINYYKNIAKKHGGEVSAHWIDSFVLIDPLGNIKTSTAKRPIILTDKIVGKANYKSPISNLYIVLPLGKYVSEMSEAEDSEYRLKPIKESLFNLFGL